MMKHYLTALFSSPEKFLSLFSDITGRGEHDKEEHIWIDENGNAFVNTENEKFMQAFESHVKKMSQY
ncbi:hypothetical protein [Serratia odorifera]|uniref:Uncharacterized protein n=2 Tax=Serratia odorifera TaxID=618 RepID=D4E6J4_SEROD|nr:hypothetical protein [Serratia odorifera]EFE94560.1 hypothetical protein HMPREF0758_3794 [Serratia odorifera DSM 4582]